MKTPERREEGREGKGKEAKLRTPNSKNRLNNLSKEAFTTCKTSKVKNYES